MRQHVGAQALSLAAGFLAATIAFVAILSPPPVAAQGLGGDSLGTLGELLDQIQQLQGLGGTARRATSPVDKARQRFENERASEGKSPSRSPDAGLETEFPEFVAAFCSGSDKFNEARLRRMVPDFSRLEADYCRRARQVLKQYGYDIFQPDDGPQQAIIGAIGKDYVLGIGDELVVSFHSQAPVTYTVAVDTQGQLILPNLPPMSAAGRTFGELKRNLVAQTAKTMLGTEVFVSLANIRNINVWVGGEVKRPGIRQLAGLAGLMVALTGADGIKKSGSLRRIQIHRGNQTFWIDLYDLLFNYGQSHNIRLFDGDRIVVSTLGSTVAVAGDVNRSGIYELAEGEKSIDLATALELAGGSMRPRGNRLLQITFDDSGRQLVTERRPTDRSTLRDGDILFVQRQQDIQSGTVDIVGHVRLPGRRSLTAAKTIRGLVPSAQSLKDNPYLPFAILDTIDPATQSRRYFAIDLQMILAGRQDFTLREFDRLIVLGAQDVRFLSSRDVQEIVFTQEADQIFPALEPRSQAETGNAPQTGDKRSQFLAGVIGSATNDQISEGGDAGDGQKKGPTDAKTAALSTAVLEKSCLGLVRLANIVRGARSGRYANAVLLARDERDGLPEFRQPCPSLFDEFPDLLAFVLEHAVVVTGEIRAPGVYPIAADTALTNLVSVSGGLTREVDLTKLEVTRFRTDPVKGKTDTVRSMIDLNQTAAEKVVVGSGDVVRFNPVFTDRDTGPVVVLGEFIRPGVYEIRRGETLSQVVRRAGGLTQQSYPYGAIFLRDRVRREEQQGFLRASRELNTSLAAAAVRKGIDPRAVVTLQEISEKLNKVQALGRIVIEADPTVLQVRPELDTVLEPGDKIFMPKRPNFVSVVGDVLNPGAMQFHPGTKADQYIDQAGGFQQSADIDRVFVVFPNGRAQPLSLSAWNYSSVQIPPGSSIVVPKDPVPFDLFTFATELTGILSKVALTAASLKVLTD